MSALKSHPRFFLMFVGIRNPITCTILARGFPIIGRNPGAVGGAGDRPTAATPSAVLGTFEPTRLLSIWAVVIGTAAIELRIAAA